MKYGLIYESLQDMCKKMSLAHFFKKKDISFHTREKRCPLNVCSMEVLTYLFLYFLFSSSTCQHSHNKILNAKSMFVSCILKFIEVLAQGQVHMLP